MDPSLFHLGCKCAGALLRHLGLVVSPPHRDLNRCSSEHWISQIPATGALVAPLDETSASAAIYKDLADAQVLQGHSEMAVRLYWRSILLDASRAQTWQHLGDVGRGESDLDDSGAGTLYRRQH